MRAEELVALGGLLHDIGKPVQRAGLYSGDHSKQGAEFLRELARSTGREEYKLLALFSEFHHWDHMNETEMKRRIREVDPERFGLSEEDIIRALWIVYEADNLSSAERESGKPEQIRPLYSVFNREKAYRPAPLDFSQGLPIPGGVDGLGRSDYKPLIRNMWMNMMRVEPRIDRLLPVLEKHLTFVSSVTAEGNVISLYDHMRMTSAIALAMFRARCTAENVKGGRCKAEKRFLLIEGDFSGIQDFIYGVTGKGTLKYLRARSAYLELIGWDIVLEILRRLGLTRANVVFNAGGHFLIMGQNTENARGELESIRKHVVEWLYREFDGKLYLALEWEAINGEELGRKNGRNLFAEARRRLRRRLDVRKLRRFSEVDGLFSEPESPERLVECPVCGREVSESELEPFRLDDDPEIKVCKTCNDLTFLGEKLPKVQGFVLSSRVGRGNGVTRGPFRYFVPHYGATPESGEVLLLKNTLEVPDGLPDDIEFVPYLVADYAKAGSNGTATFEELAASSIGVKRLGVLKGDVDNLGLFFGKMDSPSKLSTASRLMDYFFKAYLGGLMGGNKSIIEQLEDVFCDVPALGPWPEEPDVVVIYAGGDDFFIVGAWDQIFQLAFRVRRAFGAYTGNSLTLSAGIGYFHPRSPIHRMAEVVSERLDRAKREGGTEKDRVFLLDRRAPRGFPLSYRWGQYETLWKTYAPRVYAGNGKLARGLESKKGLLWKILEFRELYVRDPEDVRWAYLTAYLLGRHRLSNLFPELVGIDVRSYDAGEPQPIYWVDGVLNVVLMGIRR